MQFVGLITHDQRVASVVSSLIPHDIISVAREKVRDFSFAFVAPLGANDNGERGGHVISRLRE